MDRRQQISDILHNLGSFGSVYFNEPTNTKMSYPCIRYEFQDRPSTNADNKRYIEHSSYTVFFISRSPSDIAKFCEAIENIDSKKVYVRFDRTYKADGLHHVVYTLTI